jgi:hypothetical protein
MHDEAATHYVDMIDQTTLGHRFLLQQVGSVSLGSSLVLALCWVHGTGSTCGYVGMWGMSAWWCDGDGGGGVCVCGGGGVSAWCGGIGCVDKDDGSSIPNPQAFVCLPPPPSRLAYPGPLRCLFPWQFGAIPKVGWQIDPFGTVSSVSPFTVECTRRRCSPLLDLQVVFFFAPPCDVCTTPPPPTVPYLVLTVPGPYHTWPLPRLTGHSSTQASLLSAEIGYESTWFARIDYQDRINRVINKNMQVRASATATK